MIRVALIGIVGVLMALQLKALKPDYSVWLCLGVSLLIFSFVAEKLSVILEGLEAVQNCLQFLCRGDLVPSHGHTCRQNPHTYEIKQSETNKQESW